MKLFVKMLTIASIVMAGTAAWAGGTEAVTKSYNDYREVYDTYAESSTQSKKVGAMWRRALAEHEAVCKKSCTPSTCGNKAGNSLCITHCPTISNCMKGNVNNHIKVLATKGMKLDKNGVPVKNVAPGKVSPTAASAVGDDVEEEAAPAAAARRPSVTRQNSRSSSASLLRTPTASSEDDDGSLDEEALLDEEGTSSFSSIGSALKRTATQTAHGVIKKGAAVVAPSSRSRSSSVSGGQDDSGSCSVIPNLANLEAAATKATLAAETAAAAATKAAAAATKVAAAPRTAPAPVSKAPAPAAVVEAPAAVVEAPVLPTAVGNEEIF